MNDTPIAQTTAAPQGVAKILTAIAKATGEMKKVGKGGENKHDNYMFASIDDFLSMVNPVCSENGLIFLVNEVAIEDFMRKGKYGESSWMRQQFSITPYHVSGESLPTVFRSVEVLRNGGTAYGSAQSYVIKQYLRGLFLIATGDADDLDLQEKGDGVIQQRQQQQQQSKPVEIAPDVIANFKTMLFGADDMADLVRIWGNVEPADVKRVQSVIDAKDARKAELQLAIDGAAQ